LAPPGRWRSSRQRALRIRRLAALRAREWGEWLRVEVAVEVHGYNDVRAQWSGMLALRRGGVWEWRAPIGVLRLLGLALIPTLSLRSGGSAAFG
jgi:hypothetical protein